MKMAKIDEQNPKAVRARPSRPQAPGTFDIPLATAIMGGILFYAWTISDERHVTAETGVGYYLGILGASMMLILLIYPMRKRIRGLRWMGAIPGWFRLHMLLGVVGPALVILHSNFTLGSLNSQVALFCMLIVAGSGYIGRFLYKRIHRGLNGRRRTSTELREETTALWDGLVDQTQDEGIEDQLVEFEQRYLSPERSLMNSIWRLFRSVPARRMLRNEVLSRTNGAAALQPRLDAYLSAIYRTQLFSVYERLFSLWHLLHLPLFFVLVAAALLHVVAVHIY